MKFSNNFNNNTLFKTKTQNNNYMNMRYFPQNTNKTFLLNNINSNSQTFKSSDKFNFDNISNPNLNSMKLYKFDTQKNNNESEEEEKIDKSDFIPIKELINKNFEEMAQSQDITKLKKFVKQMAFQMYKKNDLPNPDNSQLKKLIIKFKDLLKYLLNLEKNMNKYNNAFEQNNKKLFNPDLNNFEKEKKYNNQIEKNEQKINYLYQKVNKYKNIIITAKKNIKRTLASFVLIIKDTNDNYYCDLCPNNIFRTYKEVQIHSLNVHRHILELRKKNYEINNNLISPKDKLEDNYLNTKMKYIEDELVTFIENLYKNKTNELKLKNNNDNNKENDENEKEIEIEKNINDNDMLILEKKINILEENQKRNQEMLIDNLNKFKSEIISQLSELKQNNNLIYTQPKLDIINKNKSINLNDINKNINNDNIISNNNLNNNDENENNNSFHLGEKYQDNSIFISVNNNINKNDNENNKSKDEKLRNNNSNPYKNEKNIIINQEKENERKLNANKTPKINLGKVTNPNFEINKDNNLQPDMNNFVSKFCEREKNILFKENMKESDYQEKYKILGKNDNSKINISKKEDELIDELKNEYQLTKEDLTKSEYNNIINDIIDKNQNNKNEQYKAYFNNMLTFLDINKDLATSIIK